MSYHGTAWKQFKCGKIRTRNNPVFGHFSRSGWCLWLLSNTKTELKKSVAYKKKHVVEDHSKYWWNQPLPDFLQNRCSKKFRNIHWKTPVLESLFNKNADLFPCEYCKIFKNSFFIEHLRWLILYWPWNHLEKLLLCFNKLFQSYGKFIELCQILRTSKLVLLPYVKDWVSCRCLYELG